MAWNPIVQIGSQDLITTAKSVFSLPAAPTPGNVLVACVMGDQNVSVASITQGLPPGGGGLIGSKNELPGIIMPGTATPGSSSILSFALDVPTSTYSSFTASIYRLQSCNASPGITLTLSDIPTMPWSIVVYEVSGLDPNPLDLSGTYFTTVAGQVEIFSVNPHSIVAQSSELWIGCLAGASQNPDTLLGLPGATLEAPLDFQGASALVGAVAFSMVAANGILPEMRLQYSTTQGTAGYTSALATYKQALLLPTFVINGISYTDNPKIRADAWGNYQVISRYAPGNVNGSIFTPAPGQPQFSIYQLSQPQSLTTSDVSTGITDAINADQKLAIASNQATVRGSVVSG